MFVWAYYKSKPNKQKRHPDKMLQYIGISVLSIGICF